MRTRAIGALVSASLIDIGSGDPRSMRIDCAGVVIGERRPCELRRWRSISETRGQSRKLSALLRTRMTTSDEVARGGRWIGAAKGRRVMSLGTLAAIVACMHVAFGALKKPDATAASVEGRLPRI